MRTVRRTMILGCLCAIFACALCDAADEAAKPQIRLEKTSADGAMAFEVGGLAKTWLSEMEGFAEGDERFGHVFSVYVVAEGKGATDAPAMLGKHSLVDGKLRFTPRFPLEPGLTYLAVFRTDQLRAGSGERGVEAKFTLPRSDEKPTTRVAAVFPTASKLPENHLRFYLHFSAPMSRGEVYTRVRLVDESGKEVPSPFLELEEELWNRSGDRLTLLFDPGRVKRGLRPREDVGPILEEGKRYTLVIDARWPDAKGRPLVAEFKKVFESLAPDDRGIDPAAWKLAPPRAGTREPLVVRFGRPLDRACLDRLVRVLAPSGEALSGEIAVEKNETEWRFTPKAAWTAG
ncbi:MAG: hypothetical protein HYS13_09610, partial [Planctomycetia bacterium]|nr:hypothetical protein [Planctomycetia bacterium]